MTPSKSPGKGLVRYINPFLMGKLLTDILRNSVDPDEMT